MSSKYNKLKEYSDSNLNIYKDKLLTHYTTFYNVFSTNKSEKNYGFPTLNCFYNLSDLPTLLSKIFDKKLVIDYTPIFVDNHNKLALYIVLIDSDNIDLLENNKLNMGKIISNYTCNLFKLESLFKTKGLVYQSIISYNENYNHNFNTLCDNQSIFNVKTKYVFDYLTNLVSENAIINNYIENEPKNKLVV